MNCNVDFKTIGERIKSEREQRGWTQAQLAEKCGGYVDQSVSNWECDRYAPNEPAIRALEKAFGIKLRK